MSFVSRVITLIFLENDYMIILQTMQNELNKYKKINKTSKKWLKDWEVVQRVYHREIRQKKNLNKNFTSYYSFDNFSCGASLVPHDPNGQFSFDWKQWSAENYQSFGSWDLLRYWYYRSEVSFRSSVRINIKGSTIKH